MTLDQLLDLVLGQAGVLIVLLIIIVTGARRDWVFGWYAKEQSQRIERLEQRLDRAVKAADNATGLANTTANTAQAEREAIRD
jgi:hypothetical protein